MGSLNCKNPVMQEPPQAGAAPPPQLRHPGGQQDGHEVSWKELSVAFPSRQDGMFDSTSSEGRGFSFSAAVPCAQFQSQAKKNESAKIRGAAASPLRLQGLSISQKKRAKKRAKDSERAAAKESDVEEFLKPSDIARARLFLCFNSDVQGGKLPDAHMELNPHQPLQESIAEFSRKFSAPK